MFFIIILLICWQLSSCTHRSFPWPILTTPRCSTHLQPSSMSFPFVFVIQWAQLALPAGTLVSFCLHVLYILWRWLWFQWASESFGLVTSTAVHTALLLLHCPVPSAMSLPKPCRAKHPTVTYSTLTLTLTLIQLWVSILTTVYHRRSFSGQTECSANVFPWILILPSVVSAVLSHCS